MTYAHALRTPAFDGTAALSECGPTLVLIEGGRPAGSPRSRNSARAGRAGLSRSQSALLALSFFSLLLVLCLASLITDALAASSSAATLSETPTQEVVVGDGDTLWGIAENADLSGCSTSEVVSWIVERNGLDEKALVPGQKLIVPAARAN
ncbi:cell division suppressor protein YneA [Thermophilibacter provencensis]|uniref:LysM peptidoglycan-binding domain-containing protein n=1 Tax=Thermophilibacter provencensis TaxID=1852386 RepID=A0ABT7V328_9ACTN|nr:LysM peptidoglycan-binding domain-containing protein [Thermophilibacter provencensis]MDM8271007.1 LysM peptidoglycan-binding domain-containing protein [Thermophilibacter provencensis]